MPAKAALGKRQASSPVRDDESALRGVMSAVLDAWPEASAAVLYGSRARGTHRPDSDWDVALVVGCNVRPHIPRQISEVWRDAPELAGMDLHVTVVTTERLVREANAAWNIASGVVREGRVLAGRWNRPKCEGKTTMEPFEYQHFIGASIEKIGSVLTTLARLGREGSHRADRLKVHAFVQATAGAAEMLGKAIVGRVVGRYEKTHDLNRLADMLPSGAAHTKMREALKGLDGDAHEHHIAIYPRELTEKDCLVAYNRISRTLDLLCGELESVVRQGDSPLARSIVEESPAHAISLAADAKFLRDGVDADLWKALPGDEDTLRVVKTAVQGRLDLVESVESAARRLAGIPSAGVGDLKIEDSPNTAYRSRRHRPR